VELIIFAPLWLIGILFLLSAAPGMVTAALAAITLFFVFICALMTAPATPAKPTISFYLIIGGLALVLAGGFIYVIISLGITLLSEGTFAPLLVIPLALIVVAAVFFGSNHMVAELPKPAPRPKLKPVPGQLEMRDLYARILIPILLLIIIGKLTGYDVTALLP
jgi:hypothetical protein